jgi:anthranilate phosphoribosyltransferase
MPATARKISPTQLRGGEPEQNAVVRDLLGRDASPGDVMLLNAQPPLLQSSDFDGALVEAERSLESGAALERLDALIAFSRMPVPAMVM